MNYGAVFLPLCKDNVEMFLFKHQSIGQEN